MDKAYIDFKRLYIINSESAYFVTRAQVNQDYRRIYSRPAEKTKGVLCDQIIALNNFYPSKFYPGKIRRIKYHDLQTEHKLIFLTNNFELNALDIGRLFQYRWKIETFLIINNQ